jgi:hypothetical protein
VWINGNGRNSKPDPPTTPEKFQETLRKNQTEYIAFADIMICAVHGKSRFADTAGTTSFNTLISKSQEAFTLLLYENGYKNWVWASQNDPGSTSDASTDGGGGNVTTNSHDCPPYGYTSRNQEYTIQNRNGDWSTEGMLKYNALYRKVAVDRDVDKGAFEKVYMAHRVSQFKARRKRKRGLTNNPVPILDDLVDLQTLENLATVGV